MHPYLNLSMCMYLSNDLVTYTVVWSKLTDVHGVDDLMLLPPSLISLSTSLDTVSGEIVCGS